MTEQSRQWARAAAMAIAMVAYPLLSSAQAAVIVGMLRDSAGAPVGDVDVSVVAQRILVRSDTTGRFTVRRIKPGAIRLEMRRIGYQPKTLDVTLREAATESVTVVLTQTAQLLPGMVISAEDMRRRIAIEDFYRRRARGGGAFITREAIEDRHSVRLSDALREIPGLQFTRSGAGMAIRFMSASVYRRDCQPQFWVDGQRVPGMQIDDFPVDDVEGVELYHGPANTPLQFSQGAITTCGTVAIWTRVPGT